VTATDAQRNASEAGLTSALQPQAVLDAAAILKGAANRTPVLTSRELDRAVGAQVFCKAEHLQRVGAFKFRGAYHALSRLSSEERARGVLTWSSGNHAAAVALAGRLLGVRTTVVMPDSALPIKRAAVLGYGAELVCCPAAERENVGRRIAAQRDLAVIPPYDHDHVIAGQGTAALELMQEIEPLDLLLAPVGGGGLLAGTALAAGLKDTRSRPRVIGVEPAIADDAARSLRDGRIVTLDHVPDTIADGLRTRFVGERNFAVMRERVHDIVTVSEEEIVLALRWLWVRMKQVVEPSGAVALAGVMAGKVDVAGKRVGVVLSGGNADPAAVARLIG
jgi:threonine dehydratase